MVDEDETDWLSTVHRKVPLACVTSQEAPFGRSYILPIDQIVIDLEEEHG